MSVPRFREHKGWPVLAAGFRPFFLLGSIQAALSILVWLPIFEGELNPTSAFAPRDWHVHEMLYGYLPAIITGFLFTAIPNWTGRLPIQGAPLATLVAVWVAGRFCVTFSAETTWWAAMLVDAGFLLLVALVAAREILAGRNWRNLTVVVLVLVLFAGNVTFHLEAHLLGVADRAIRVGIAVVILLISLVGGRIIPSFTRNWLMSDSRTSQAGAAGQDPGRLPAPFGRFDKIVIATSAVTLACWIVVPDHRITGIGFVLVGLLHVVRLLRWAGERTYAERLLLILHIGYTFVPLGFLLGALAIFGYGPVSAGIHCWMVGGAGIMTLAVMTRATLGHTGQQLTASPATQTIYGAIIIAAVARIVAALAPPAAGALLHVAAFAWVIAFFGYAIAFGPLLLGGRRRARRPSKAVA